MRILIALLLVIILPLSASAAQTALLADKVTYDSARDLMIAEGNVEVLADGQRIRADRVIFDNANGTLRTEGSVRIEASDGTILLMDGTELSAEAQSGLIYGARLLLAENFQFAAVEARQIDQRYTTLYRAIGSSCQVCAAKPVPLWLMRAEEVVRDELEKQIYLKGATLELAGVTVAYLPYFRMADPSARRATGFLNPAVQSSDIYGTGLRIPYYIVTSEASDVTITPFLTTGGAALIEAEYRQLFAKGDLTVTGSIAADDGSGSHFRRGHIFVDGAFDLGDDYSLSIDVKRQSDRGYLREFGYTDTDRLASNVTLRRDRPQETFTLSAISYQSLRDDEEDADLPNALPELVYRRYWDTDAPRGRAHISADAANLYRRNGQDVFKLGVGADWEATRRLPFGLLGAASVGLAGQVYTVGQNEGTTAARSHLSYRHAGLELRWPLIRRAADGAQHLIEPVALLTASRVDGDMESVPNEDSSSIEFDATNLFALSRYPGTDRREDGLRLNFGANYTRIDPTGWEMDLSLGRVFRREATSGFPTKSGLNGIASNFVAAASLELPPNLRLASQAMFDDRFSFARHDLQAGLTLDPITLDATYVYLAEDAGAGIPHEREEFRLDGAWAFDDNWAFDASWRRNLAEHRNVSAEFGITFRNECIATRFSASRRFTTSDTVPASTEFGLSVDFAGLGGSRAGRRGACVEF